MAADKPAAAPTYEKLRDTLRELAWEAATEPALRGTSIFQEALDVLGPEFRAEVEAEVRREN